MRSEITFWVLCMLSLPVTAARAQAQSSEPDAALESRGLGAVFVQGGWFGYDTDPQVPGLAGQGTWGLGLSFYPGLPFPSQLIGFDFNAWGVERSYRSTVQGAAEPLTQVSTQAFSLGARVGVPQNWPLRVAVLGGLTYVDHAMEVAGEPAWFLPGLDQTYEEDDAGWAPYWGLAGELRARAWGLGLEKRWVNTSATFDEPFSLSDVDLGGSALFVTLTWYGVPGGL